MLAQPARIPTDDDVGDVERAASPSTRHDRALARYGAGVRTAFAHEAVLLLEDGVDDRAPGAAITASLCGSWTHSGPCPTAPHHTAAHREGPLLRVRILFAVEQQSEAVTRDQIVTALAGKLLNEPSEGSGWRLLGHHVGKIRSDEAKHASRLAEAG